MLVVGVWWGWLLVCGGVVGLVVGVWGWLLVCGWVVGPDRIFTP